MADYKGGGLTTVHIREASKLVESVRAEVEQLKKSVLEVDNMKVIWMGFNNFLGDGNRQHKPSCLCDGGGLCDSCRRGRRRSQIENSWFGYAQRTQGRVPNIYACNEIAVELSFRSDIVKLGIVFLTIYFDINYTIQL